MQPDDARPEIKRLVLMGAHTQPRHRGPVWLWPLVMFLIGIAVIAGLVWGAGAASDRNGSHPRPVTTPTSRSEPTLQPDLVARAQLIKPLHDSANGDRVLFQGRVCLWRDWTKNDQIAQVQCPGDEPADVDAGRLTPVETRSAAPAPSKS